MPAAKSDLLSWAGHDEGAVDGARVTRLSRSSKNGGSSSSGSISSKVACLACRKIKVRCLMPHRLSSSNTADTTESTTSCLRCARLDLECLRTPHQKGGRPVKGSKPQHVASFQFDSPLTTPIARQQRGRSDSAAVLYDWAVDVDDEELRREVEHQQMMVTDPPSRLKNHSIKSILDSDDGQALHRLHNIAVNTSLSEKKASASSIRPSTLGKPQQPSAGPGVETKIDIVRQGIFSTEETRELHTFFFEKLHGIIALLTPSLNTFDTLSSRRSTQFLFSAICTVSSRYVFESRYLQALQYIRTITSKFLDGAWPATIENCQALSILCMWRHPQDSSGWRKLHAAITMAYERNLHNIASKATTTTTTAAAATEAPLSEVPSVEMVQAQRTYFHLGCFEEFFVNQRQLVPYIRWEYFPNARRWIESIGERCLDIDIKIATAMDTISICRRLSRDLEEERAKQPRGHAGSLQEIRLIKLALAEQKEAAHVWLNAKARGMKDADRNNSSQRTVGAIFDNINYQLNYWQALFAIYCRSDMRQDALYSADREEAFNQASLLATEMLETFHGPYGQDEYYRFLHEHVIYSLASATVWIVDNWNAMSRSLAVRAHNAMRTARDVTLPSKERLWEQSAYLHNFLSFCCSKLPSLPVLHETSQIDINTVGISDDLRRLLQGSITQLSPSAAFDELYSFPATTQAPPYDFLTAQAPAVPPAASETNMGTNDDYGVASDVNTTAIPSLEGIDAHAVPESFLSDSYADESVMQFFHRLLQDTPSTTW